MAEEPKKRASTQDEGDAAELLPRFEELMQKTWTNLSAFIGDKATGAVLENARKKTAKQYAQFEKLKIVAGGVDVEEIRKDPGHAKDLNLGIIDFFQNIIDLLVELTGDVLTSRIKPLLSEFGPSEEQGGESGP
jgi:hypothetical protein